MTLSYAEFRSTRYFTALDGLRAVAVLTIISAHVPGGYFRDLHGYRGVFVFFVLSGFLVTTHASREEDERGRLDVWGFLVRRMFRILPLYYVVLAVNAIVVYVVSPGARDMAAFSHNWPYYAFLFPEYPGAVGVGGGPFWIAWPLGVALKFYVIWSLVAYVLLRGRPHVRVAIGVFLAVVVAGIAAFLAGSLAARLTAEYVFLLLGSLLALMLHDRRGYAHVQVVARGAWAAGLAAVTIAVWIFADSSRALDYLFGVLVALVLAGLVVGRSPITWASSVRVLVWVGVAAYPLYLIQVLALDVAKKLPLPGDPGSLAWNVTLLVLAIGIGLVAALVLHRWFEQPMIALGRKLSGRAALR